MRIFIFIMMLLFGSTAIAGGTNNQNRKYYGFHKNDKCDFSEAAPLFKTEPNYCSYTDKRGCCATYSEEYETHVVSCYEYNHPIYQSCVWDFDRFED